jgi:type 1 fimbriae regulatory protein FimB/type 1 fimbriae regulatory protein FimE
LCDKASKFRGHIAELSGVSSLLGIAAAATTAGFLKTIARTGKAAKLSFPIHPHMLRHSTGYKLANDWHDTRALQHYMGHKGIMHTVRYTEMAPDRFKNFRKD